MKVLNICSSSWGSNCYALIHDGHALIIDPSASVTEIVRAVSAEGAVIDAILLTHGHFDHIVSLDTLREKIGVPAAIHEKDAEMLLDGRKNAFYTFFGMDRAYKPAEWLLTSKSIIPFGDKQIQVIHTPGHTQGSVCYLADDILFSGDTLFAESYGRCDLYGGDIMKMKESLSHLRTLDPSLTLYSGHGPASKLGIALDNAAYLI